MIAPLNATEALQRCLESTATQWGSSRWSEFRACPYGHHLRFEEGVSPRPNPERDKLDYFHVGSAVHGATAFAAMGILHRFDAPWRVVLEEAEKRGVWGIPEVEEARRLLFAYFAMYGSGNAGYGYDYKIIDVEPDGWEVELPGTTAQSLSVEAFARGELIQPTTFKYTTRPDAVLRRVKTTVSPLGQRGHAHRARRFVLVETKTRSRSYSEDDLELSQMFKTRPQFLGHVYVAREILGEIPDLLVNLIIKTKIPAMRRVVVRFTDEDLDRWAQDHVASIANRSLTERWRNYSSCAPEIGQKCWGFDWCHGGAKERKTLYMITRKPSYEDKPDGEKNAPAKRQKWKAPTERQKETEARRAASVARPARG